MSLPCPAPTADFLVIPRAQPVARRMRGWYAFRSHAPPRIGPAPRAASAAWPAAVVSAGAGPGPGRGACRMARAFRRAVEGSRPAWSREGDGAGAVAAPGGRAPLVRGQLAPLRALQLDRGRQGS